MKRKPIAIGIILTALLLFIGIATLRDYGLTWDFHFHFFSGANFFGLKPADVEPRSLPYVEPDPRNAIRLPYGPFVQIVPFASWLLFYKNLNILPYDVAYNLPIVAAGALGITVLYFFLAEAINWRVGFIAAIFLALTPRYFADIHNNMKDIPSASVFALNIWMLWRLVRYQRLKDLVFAVLAFAIAFNIKINSIYIPLIFAVWLIFQRKLLTIKQCSNITIYFLLSPLLAFLLWSAFWPDPVGQLKHAWLTFGIGTNNIEVLLNGLWYCSGTNVPWYYPYWYLAITTPLLILIFFFVGLGLLFLRTSFSMNHELSTLMLLVLWFFLPLTRYLIPKIGVIDGIRHFEEVLFPLSALAAIGAAETARFLTSTVVKQRVRTCVQWTNGLAAALVFVHLVWNIVSYHPFQIAYFNELVGGIRGAFGKYDLDYWGSSQKHAVRWLNDHAPKDAVVHIVMSADVAGIYLRPDLLSRLNTTKKENADFVVVLNRQSFFYRYFYLWEYLLRNKPIHTITVQGVPLVWIFDNKQPQVPPQPPWWSGEDPCIMKYWDVTAKETIDTR